MSFDDTTSYYSQIPAAYLPPKAPRRTKRSPNYRGGSTAATLRKQDRIRELLALAGEGLTIREIGNALGISRQLALYHVKKLAASRGCALVMEACAENGGLQFKVWDEIALATHYSRFLLQTFPAERAQRISDVVPRRHVA